MGINQNIFNIIHIHITTIDKSNDVSRLHFSLKK